MKGLKIQITIFLVYSAIVCSHTEEEIKPEEVKQEDTEKAEEPKTENAVPEENDEDHDPYQEWKRQRDALYEEKQESVDEVETNPGYERWLRQREIVPEEYTEEETKRERGRSEDKRGGEEKIRRY